MSAPGDSASASAAGSGDLGRLLVGAADLDAAGLEDFTEMDAPSSDEDPPPMTGPTAELTALLNTTFGDKASREVRTSFINADSSIVVDVGVSERPAGAAAAWMADMRRVCTECAGWSVTFDDQEIVIGVVDPADDPGKPLQVEQQFGDEALMRTMLVAGGELGRITTLLVRDGDRALELTFRSSSAEPGSPEAAELDAAKQGFLALAPARFLGLPTA